MLTKRFLLTGVVALAAMPDLVRAQPASPSPGFVHRLLMRGGVVHSEGGTLVLCIGRAEGAEVGQVFKVYRSTVRRAGGGGGRRSTIPSFIRSEVGTVRIDTVVDDHFANATRLSGDVRVNDIVELESSVSYTPQ